MAKKLFAVVLAAAMVLGLVSTAFAAGFSDVSGAANEKAILQLASLGLLKGYDDGTFRPNGNITRAEFAAVVVRALGFETSASLLKYAPKFPDCAEVPWAWGYINVATNQGIVKGYPDGTFGPQKNVTVAEAITMLVRALGRDFEATGEWPTGHVMVAGKIGMLPSNLTGIDVPATRGLVAQLVSNVLTVPIVRLNPETAKAEPVESPNTILARNSASSETGLVTAVNLVDKEITIEKTKADGTKEPKTLALSASILYTGANELAAFKGQTVSLFLNADDEIVYIASSTKGFTGTITAVDKVAKSVTVNGVAYVVRDDATVTVNGAARVGDALTKIADLKGAYAAIVLDSNGKVTYLEATKLDQPKTLWGKVTKIESGTTAYYLVFKVDTTYPEYRLASDATIKRNGAPASFADLKAGDSISYALNASSQITYVDAFSLKVTGLLQEKYVVNNHKSWKVDGVVYESAVDAYGEDTATEAANLSVGTIVVVSLDKDGKVIDVSLPTVTTGTDTVTLASTSVQVTASGVVKTISLTNGTTLTLDGSCTFARNGIGNKDLSDLTAGDLLVLTTSPTSGKVTDIKAFAPVSGTIKAYDETNKIVTIQNSNTDTNEIARVKYQPGLVTLMENGIQTVAGQSTFTPGREIKVTSWLIKSPTEAYGNLIVRDTDRQGVVKGTFVASDGSLGLVVAEGANDKYLVLDTNAVLHRSDAPISVSDVVIGEIIKYKKVTDPQADGTTVQEPYKASYAYVKADTTAPKITVTVSGTAVNVAVTEASGSCLLTYKVYGSTGTLKKTVGPVQAGNTHTQQNLLSDLAEGTYTVVVSVKDFAGNVGSPASVSIEK